MALIAGSAIIASAQVAFATTPAYTVPGGVRTLNGTSNYDTYAYISDMAKPSQSGRISMTAWVCPNQTDISQMVFKREGAYQLLANPWNDPRFYFAVWTSTGIHGLVSNICLDTLGWQHIAGTYDGTNWRLYHNGSLVGSMTESDGYPVSGGTAPMWVGANIEAGGIPRLFFGGSLSSMNVYDVVLTQAEVAALAANPPSTLPAPTGSSIRTQTVNGIAIQLEVGNGLRLKQISSNISSNGGRLFVVNVNGVPISSDRVQVRQPEITTLNSGWQIPFNLPGTQGTGVLEILPGDMAGLLQAKLSLKNSGTSSTWQVAFPYLEGTSLNGLSPSQLEFFFPFQEGWTGCGQYDLTSAYGHRAWLPVMAAWNPSGPGIAIQGRDTNFGYCILRVRNANAGTNPTAYYPGTDVASVFHITKSGATLARHSLPFTLGTNATWNAPSAVIQVFDGTKKFKDVLSNYGQWARTYWWLHNTVPSELRDRFIVLPKFENNGGNWWGGYAENLQDTYNAHPIFEWAFWWDHDESISCGGKPHLQTQGNYWFESNWGGASAYAADIARCRAAGTSSLLYLQGKIVWKDSDVGLTEKTDWGWMDSPDHYNEDYTGSNVLGCIGDFWSMCPQATGWQTYLADACQDALQGSGADGVRVDSEAEAVICYNPNHQHTDPLNGVLAFLETVRNGVDMAGTGKSLMGEFCGSDAAAQYLDGSLAQGHDASLALAGQMFGYGVLPFRFVYPEVKLFEWGDMSTDASYHLASRRMLFNGVGTTKGTGNATYLTELFHYSEALRGVGDVLASIDCEPLYSTMASGVIANRFSLNGREVYTLWNRSGAQVSGQVISIAGGIGRRFMNMVTGNAITTTRNGNNDIVNLTIPNDEVIMIGVFPNKIIHATRGSSSYTFYVQSNLQLSLEVVDSATDEVLLSGGTSMTVDDSVTNGRAVVVRAVKDSYLIYDCLKIATGIQDVQFIDTFDTVPNSKWNSWPSWASGALSVLTLCPPNVGNACWITSNSTYQYVQYTARFRTSVDTSNYAYMGFMSRSPWGNPAAYVRLDNGALRLVVGNGSNINGNALTSPTVTPNIWHTVSIIRRPTSVELIYDGVSVGTVTSWVPTTFLPLIIDATRNASAVQTLELDDIVVSNIP